MSGFLDRLAARAVGEVPLVRPRVRSRFEPGGGGLLPVGPQEAPELEAAPSLPPPEDVALARPVPAAPEAVETAVAAPRVAPRIQREAPAAAAQPPREAEAVERAEGAPETPHPLAPSPTPSRRPGEGEIHRRREGAPLSRQADAGRLEPRAKGPFPLGGDGLEKGEGQDGGGFNKGDLEGGRPHARSPHPLAPSPTPSRPAGEGEKDRGEERAPFSRPAGGDGRGDGGEGSRAAASALPTVSRRADVAADLPVTRPDEPSETVVHVHIGRIDVRAPQPPPSAAAPAAPRRRAEPQVSLADYLKRREERRR